MVHLKEELELARHYLSMQQLRFENALSVRIMLPPDMQQGFVPVYSIQLLIENAIKHNILTNNQPLEISITGDVENDTITVCNNIQTRLTVENGSGVGLSNLSERYQMMGNWPVLVKRENNLFKVTIKVLNDAGSDY
jgi:LytS/YehU family sensor histidine kinase